MKKVVPEDYILAILSPKERFEAAVRNVRKKAYAERQKKNPSRR